jgi:2'-5' RNA ligase
VAQGLAFLFDDGADRAVRALWSRLDEVGVPSLAGRGYPPHVTFAVAGTIPPLVRDALRADLARLSIPALWLSTLAAFSSVDTVLMLAAVVDTELLAVHSAVHDALAGRVKQPSAYYLPGAWVPHCTLAQSVEPAQVATGFATLYPLDPIRATVREIAIIDTHTGAADPLLQLPQPPAARRRP